jgi:hypothetical protein
MDCRPAMIVARRTGPRQGAWMKRTLTAMAVVALASGAQAQSQRQGQFLDQRQMPVELDLGIDGPTPFTRELIGSSMRKSMSTKPQTRAKAAVEEKRTKLTIEAGVDSGYNTNVFLTKNDRIEDFQITPSLGFKIASIPQGDSTLSFGFGASVSFDRFSRPEVASEADSDTAAASVGLAWKGPGKYVFKAAYSPQVTFGPGFGARQQTTHALVTSVGREFLLGVGDSADEFAKITPSIAFTRAFIDPYTKSSTSLGIGADLKLGISKTTSIVITPGIKAIAYDHTTASKPRYDFRFGVSIGLNWEPSENVQFAVGAGVLHRISTIPDIDVTQFTAGPSIGASGVIKF